MKASILIFAIAVLTAFAPVPDQVITGLVTDSSKQPLVGVNVLIKGTTTGTQTDANGKYWLTIPKGSKYLQFSFVGYLTKEVKIGTNPVINVTLDPDSKALEEVVVVGYGIQHKSMNVGASKRMASPMGYSDQAFSPASTENYNPINENGFQTAKLQPVTTFSIDVDRAAYSNTRRFLNSGQLPPVDAVRIEEMINYFDYDYPQPTGKHPLSISTELTDSPWNKGLKLLHIGLQAKTIPTDNLPASNLVFLIDVSGSMFSENKLPLLKQAFKLLVDQLRPQDKVAIVVYAGAAGIVLPATSGNEKLKIKEALDQLQAGGSTAGGAGIELAYKLAAENFQKNGNNRVILATDGDFNVGVSSEGGLQRLIEEKRKTGVYLSIMGFGMGNYKDSHVETLADKGNGNYAYIDNIQEARKVFINEFGGTLFTLAKDVKLQLEFNPELVQGYRLIGYENRALKNEEFHDDKKDAGEMGSGHSVTAIYEIIPVGVQSYYLGKTDELKYQSVNPTQKGKSTELATVKIRYKEPDQNESKLFEQPISNTSKAIEATSTNFRFAMSVAEFGLLLRNSDYKGKGSYQEVINRAKGAFGKDEEGYRSEFVQLVKTAMNLDNRKEMASAE